MKTLNQIVAVEKEMKARLYGDFTVLHHESSKPDKFNGFHKTYRKKDENGEDFPPEGKKIELTGQNVLNRMRNIKMQIFDIVATKDSANCNARADVVVNGQILIANVPAQYLIFLEKEFIDIRKFIQSLPTLDEGETWILDTVSGTYRTEPITVHRSKKMQKGIVLYDATEHHPAQTQLISEDFVVGYWDTVKQSSALTVQRKQELLDRVETLIREIKFAREKANITDAPPVEVSKAVFDYLLA